MSDQSFDVVVIGAGPAGLSAAAEIAEAGLSCVTIDRMGPGGQLMNLGVLQGMPDLEPGAMGPDLLASLAERAMTAGADIAIDDVASVDWTGGFVIQALDGRYRAKAVVVATGLTPGTTGLEGETRFEGAGLSHCAHCDAPMYAGQSVVVAGRDAWAIEEVIELAGYASDVVLVADGPLEAPPGRLAALRSLPNAAVVEGRIITLNGSPSLESIVVAGPDGERVAPARGLFLQTGRVPALGLLAPGASRPEGLFLAGDVRDGVGHSLGEAIADGARAGHYASDWVRTRQGT
jgi:thioredoxin reductase